MTLFISHFSLDHPRRFIVMSKNPLFMSENGPTETLTSVHHCHLCSCHGYQLDITTSPPQEGGAQRLSQSTAGEG